MDFIPSLNISKQTIPQRTTVNKLSLKSRRNYSQSQSYSQIESESSQTQDLNISLSQPVLSTSHAQVPLVRSTRLAHLAPHKEEEELESSQNVVQSPSKQTPLEPTEPSETTGQPNSSVAASSTIENSGDTVPVIEVIDISTPPEDPATPLQEPLMDKETTRSRAVKPALDKLKKLKSNSDEVEWNANTSDIAPKQTKKPAKSNKRSKKVKELNDDEMQNGDYNSSSNSEEDDSIISESRKKFATQLQNFERPEQKKFTLHSTSEDNLTDSQYKYSDLPPSNETEEICPSNQDDIKNPSPRSPSPTPIAAVEVSPSPFKRPQLKPKSKALEAAPVEEPAAEPAGPETAADPTKDDQLPCPLCNKQVKNRRAHMKSCATKNGVSTAQLLKAIELQDKQASERRALGLPAIVPQAKQTLFKKKPGRPGSSNDPSIQLAIALSRSLMEAEERHELLETRRVLGDDDFCWDTDNSALPSTSTAPPVIDGHQLVLASGSGGSVQLSRAPVATTGRRGRVPTAPSQLLRTTQEERERRITQKVAMLLVGDEDVPKLEAETTQREPLPPLSSKLNKLQCKSSQLWEMTTVSPSTQRDAFYVEQLSEFVSPSKHQPGTGLRHLSQIPGRLKTPEKMTEAERILELSRCSFVDCTQPDAQFITPDLKSKPSTSMLSNNPASSSPEKARNTPARPQMKDVEAKSRRREGLSRDWSQLLNSRTMSDVTVYVRGELELRAHSLVLYARCPGILEDIAKEMSPGGRGVREQMLLWGEASRETALAMLEFLYCDTTERATLLSSEDLQELTDLAKRYRVKELLQHLIMLSRVRSDVDKFVARKSASPTKHLSPTKSPPSTPPKKFSPAKNLLNSPVSRLHKSPVPVLKLGSPAISIPSVSSKKSQSPDMFDDSSEDDANQSCFMVENEAEERPDIDFLLSMVAKEKSQSFVPQSVKSPLNKSQTPSPVKDGKRKYESPASQGSTALKKLCTEIPRKRLTLDQDSGKSVSPNSRRVNEMNSSQLLDFLENKVKPTISSDEENGSLKSGDDSDTLREDDKAEDVFVSSVWDNFDNYEAYEPPLLPSPKSMDKSPEAITISSTTTSQNSKVSSEGSSQTLVDGMNTTVKRALEQSLDAFNSVDLSGLERAALTAYTKVVTPLPQVSTPVSRVKQTCQPITPMADYSIMASPDIQRELDKYGIKKLRRNQAKLILRHIYNELHPLVPATPVAGPSSRPDLGAADSPVSRPRGGRGSRRARGRRGATRTETSRAVHNISLSQPLQARESSEEEDNTFVSPARTGPRVSYSQPVVRPDDSDDSSQSDSSSDDESDETSLLELDEVEGSAGLQVLETAEAVREAMSRLVAAEPQLHHRILMYEPLWLAELQTLLRKHGSRCNPRMLLDYLDEHCITFRTPRPPRPARGTQKRRSPRKTRGSSQSQRATRGRKKMN